ncbi:tubulin-specific chaperone E [Anabas testudineus]|uniref:Tubulin-specific chaperone E n=1 Tax=Anabas testudineus TaxID=64144 RepID=A0A7N6APF4_ANATE|nr:tubulin-specific chaperone E [Anabas testudineus]
MEPEVPGDAVGRRVSIGGERATVRYVGPVPPTTGLWLGVEWDSPERGKHNGTHEGVQYFTCRHPKGGSFVRPAKVSFGVDYLNAVQQLYEINADEVLSEEISISSKKLKWGGVKERSFESLPSVLLSRCEVNGPGADGEIRRTTPNVQWLDLSGTLMSCWEDVAAITEQLDKLEGLQLSYNRLRLPSEPSALCQAFCNLKVLALNSCDLTWPQILNCAPMWPQLEDLCLEENNITELQRPEGVLQPLRSLNLSSNPLVQHTVFSMSALPRLEKLNLSRTGLSDVRFDDAAPGSQTSMFPELKNLNLDHNNITEWCVVDELAKLPSLVQFSCRGNRLVSSDGNPKTANQMLIAKLGQLVTLNSCEIYPEDRRGAELDYIKMFGEEWLKAGGQSQTGTEFTCRHPRYQNLIDKYGAPEEGELKKPEPFVLKNQLLKVTFVFPDDAERKPIEKKLPASMDVQKVKGLLYRLLKVPAADLKLTYTSPKMAGTEFEIDSDLKTLQFYSIEDGDQVLVRWS